MDRVPNIDVRDPIGESHPMCQLRDVLERDGLVERTVTPTSPPRVDYALTSVGETLSDQVSGLIVWAENHREYVAASRTRYDNP